MNSVAKLLLTLVFAFGIASAQPPGGMGMGMGGLNMSFASLDADSNGELTIEELGALPPVQAGRVTAEGFLGQWDTDGNGTVSEEEFNNRQAPGGR